MNQDNSFPTEKINKKFLGKFTEIYTLKKMKIKKLSDELVPGKKYYMFHTSSLLDFKDRDPDTIIDNLKREEQTIWHVLRADLPAEKFVFDNPNMNIVWGDKVPQPQDTNVLISRFEQYGLSATYVGEQKVMTRHQYAAQHFPSEGEWFEKGVHEKQQLLSSIGIYNSSLGYPTDELKELKESKPGIYRAFKNLKFEFGNLSNILPFENMLVYREQQPNPKLEEGIIQRDSFFNLVLEHGESRHNGIEELKTALEKPNGIEELVFFEKDSTEDFPTILIDYDDDDDEEPTSGKKMRKGSRGGKTIHKKKHRSQRRRRTKRKN